MTTTFIAPKEIRALSYEKGKYLTKGVLVKPDTTNYPNGIERGTVMALFTGGASAGLYIPYSNAGTDGQGVAVGVLVESITANEIANPTDHLESVPAVRVQLDLAGAFIQANLIGLDANAITDLGAVTKGDMLII